MHAAIAEAQPNGENLSNISKRGVSHFQQNYLKIKFSPVYTVFKIFLLQPEYYKWNLIRRFSCSKL